MARRSQRPIQVVVDDYELVVAGITAVLAPYADRVRVAPYDAPGAGPRTVPDIALVGDPDHAALDPSVTEDRTRVVVFSWDLSSTRVAHALGRGAAGYVAKSLPAQEIVAALERVHAGETVVAPAEAAPAPLPDFSPREAEAVALLVRGLSNQEIAERLQLSVNSVKTYLRTAFRKLGVSRRSQVVGWALASGFVERDVPDSRDDGSTGRRGDREQE